MSPVCLEVFHDTLRFFVRCTVAVIVIACLVCHDHDTLLYQPVKALLQRGVHFGDSGCKPFGIEAVIVHCSFPPPEEKKRFEAYLQKKLDLIQLPNKDEDFLRQRILTMYANPAINHLKAIAQ